MDKIAKNAIIDHKLHSTATVTNSSGITYQSVLVVQRKGTTLGFTNHRFGVLLGYNLEQEVVEPIGVCKVETNRVISVGTVALSSKTVFQICKFHKNRIGLGSFYVFPLVGAAANIAGVIVMDASG